MAKTQSAAASKKADAKTPAQKGQTAPAKTRQVAAGTLTGPKGAKLEEHKPDVAPEIPVEQRQGERRQAQQNAVAQFAQSQMAAPAIHAPELTPEQKLQQEFQAKVAELAASMGVTMPALKLTAAPRANKDQRNGVTRPAAGTKTGKVWDVADAISMAQNGNAAAVSQVKAHPDLKTWNDHTIKTQYAAWRRYHGIKGRVEAVQTIAGITTPEAAVQAQQAAATPAQ